MMILNLTQHEPTASQIEAGVIHPTEHDQIKVLLNFDNPPAPGEVEARAHDLAEIAAMSDAWGENGPHAGARVMIGGALWLMAPLIAALRERGLEPVFSFSKREVVETTMPDGSVRKVSDYRHLDWVPA